MTPEERLTMLTVHSLQTEAWAESVLIDPRCKQDFKVLVKAARAACARLNQYTQSHVDNDSYELSAEISDNLLVLARLTPEQLDKVTQLIDEFVKGS